MRLQLSFPLVRFYSTAKIEKKSEKDHEQCKNNFSCLVDAFLIKYTDQGKEVIIIVDFILAQINSRYIEEKGWKSER